ncbi:hypothetical protein GCM10010517_76130 [Streptosporangium fragile]|uniref:Uncharacterized protein n=1 Tax=Streptosporangium fragile TaxID=46186 RepID=A0ABN3WCC5_9ACTN
MSPRLLDTWWISAPGRKPARAHRGGSPRTTRDAHGAPVASAARLGRSRAGVPPSVQPIAKSSTAVTMMWFDRIKPTSEVAGKRTHRQRTRAGQARKSVPPHSSLSLSGGVVIPGSSSSGGVRGRGGGCLPEKVMRKCFCSITTDS